MRVISKANASSLDFGGQTYEPGPDGVFDFPEPVGVELTTKHASMWVAEDTFNTQAAAAQRDALRDPNFMVTVVAGLLGRVAALEANAGAASKPKAPKAETPPPAPAVEAPKLTAAQKRAAAKKAAAAKTSASKPKAGAATDPAPEDAAPEPEPGEQPEAAAEGAVDDIKLRDDASA